MPNAVKYSAFIIYPKPQLPNSKIQLLLRIYFPLEKSPIE